MAELAQLETRGLLRLSTAKPQAEYEFRHTLFRDTAYRSLLMEERKRLHGLIGEIVERSHADRIDSIAARLADHFAQAGRRAKTLTYSKLAGSEALRVHAYDEAAAYFELALKWAGVQPIFPVDLQGAYLDLGRALELAAHFELARDNYLAMRDAARDLGSRKMELSALTAVSTLYCTSSPLMDREEGARLSRKTLAEAREIGETKLEIQAHWNLMLALGSQIGREDQALAHGQEGLELADRFEEEELGAYLRNDLGRINVFCGNLRRGEELVREAESRWRRLQNKPMLVDSLMTKTLVLLTAGRLSEYSEVADEAQGLAEEIGNLWAQAYSLMMHDRYCFEIGRFGRALESSYRALERGREIEFFAGMAMSNIVLGKVFAELGLAQEALASAEQALRELDGRHHPFADEAHGLQAAIHLQKGEPEAAAGALSKVRARLNGGEGQDCLSISSVPVRIIRAELDLAQGRADRALHRLETLESRLKARSMGLSLMELLELKGRTLLHLGEFDEAAQALRRGQELAEGMGAKRARWQILSALAGAEEAQGRNSAADPLWRQSRSVVMDLADSLEGRRDLRESFLGRPAVKRVLEASS